MNQLNAKTIFFDYDGTLHDSMAIYFPAFSKAYQALVESNQAPDKTWTYETVSKFLGQTPKEMWASFGSDISETAKQNASKAIGNTMETLIRNEKANLYDGALETLKVLKARGYKLVFISNCKTQYMKNHTEIFNLDDYFDLMVCAEMYDYAPKTKVLENIAKDFPKPHAIVGDRHHDMEAGTAHNMIKIACTYGFGSSDEHQEADITIDDIKELQKIFI